MGWEIQYSVTGYLIVMNILGFAMMGIDKRRAVKKAWRIQERTLLFIACIGGGIGAFLGMYLFRHKTKKVKFIVSLPLAAAVYFVIILGINGLII
jgi:uncharacterized membrane protein YsdA (DUF1294 family)